MNMKEIEQIQSSNSKPDKPIDFMKLSKDYSFPVSKVQKHNFFGPIRIGSSSGFPNDNNQGKDENINKEKNSDSRSFSCFF
jgi:hypothetical protein